MPKFNRSLIYVQGYRSVPGQSGKADLLRPYFKDVFAIKPDQDPDIFFGVLQDKVEKEKPLLVVGSSLGGFFTHCLSIKLDQPVILINPCLDPARHLKDEISSKAALQFQEMEQSFVRSEQTSWLQKVFLAADDEVINKELILSTYASDNLYLVNSGGHRFEGDQNVNYWLKSVLNFAHELIGHEGGKPI